MKKQYIKYLYLITFPVVLIFLIIASSYPHEDSFTDPLIPVQYKASYLNNRNKQTGEFHLGKALYVKKNDVITVTGSFDKEPVKGDSLIFQTIHSKVTILYEGKIIYQFGEPGTYPPILGTPGIAYHVVNLPPGAVSSKLTFDFTVLRPDYNLNINSMYLGTKSSLYQSILSRYGIQMLIILFIITIGIIMLLLPIVLKFMGYDVLIYSLIGLTAIFSGIWFATECQITFLIFRPWFIIHPVSLISLYVLPLPLMLFLYLKYNLLFKKFIGIIIQIISCTLLLVILLQITGITPLYRWLKLFQFLSAFGAIFIIFSFIYQYLKTKDRSMIRLGFQFSFLGITTVIEAINYYINIFPRAGIISQIGLLTTFLFIFCDLGQYAITILKQSTTASVYKALATQDALTGLKNRTAYEEQMSLSEAKKYEYKNISLAVFDVNYLKLINDQMGHKMGDLMLMNAANLIQQSFSNSQVYRIGGDEFVTILYDDDVKSTTYFKNYFTEKMRQYNEHKDLPIVISMGVATFDKTIDNHLSDVFVRADKEMYLNKQYLKSITAQIKF